MSLKAGKSASVSTAMTKIAALLQVRSEDPGADAQVDTTPEDAFGVFNQALEDLIKEIEVNVESKITASKDATQLEIENRIGELRTATTDLLEAKEQADHADLDWMTCVSNERQMAVDIETANKELSESRSSRGEACQLQQDHREFRWNADPEELLFECDISLTPFHNCDSQYTEYVDDVNSMISNSLEGELETAAGVYEQHRLACVAATEDEAQKQSTADDAVTDYIGQHQLCVTRHGTRDVAMCHFETSYNHKCDKKVAFETLERDINAEDGGDWSHPDRVNEWTTTSITKCMLRSIIDSTVITTAQVGACEADVDTSHLNLDMMGEDFADLTSKENFSCLETTITFNGGKAWSVPTSAPEPPAPSDEYTQGVFDPALPFAFCQSTGGPGK